MVTAKFTVAAVKPNKESTQIVLTPDYAEGRNAEWAYYTPAGQAFTVTFEPED